jgi:hypothetical protein
MAPRFLVSDPLSEYLTKAHPTKAILDPLPGIVASLRARARTAEIFLVRYSERANRSSP